MRKTPRFESRTEVDVRVEGRAELDTLWMKNISTGGLFVETNDPPAMRTFVDVALKTPDGVIKLQAEVVHRIDAERAAACGHPAGVGLQFREIDQATKAVIAEYVAGIRATLEQTRPQDDRIRLSKEVLAVASRVREALERSDLYAALDSAPDATTKQIRNSIQRLRELFESPPPDLTPPQAARLASAARQVKRLSAHLLDERLRLQYDLRNGYVRAEDRIAAAREEGDDPAALRDFWFETFPDKADAAREQAGRALRAEASGRYVEAHRLGVEALALDPFNQRLRVEVSLWAARKPKGSPGAKSKPTHVLRLGKSPPA